MKRFLLTIVIISIVHVVNAQYFKGGLIGGVSGSQIDSDGQAGYNKIGGIGGAYVSYPVIEKGFLNLELFYIGKGAVKNIETPSYVLQEFKTSLHYIEVPVMFSYRFFEKFSFGAGFNFSYLFSYKLYNMGILFYQELFPFDIGGNAEAEYHLTEKFSFLMRISRGMINMQKNGYWANSNLLLTFKYKF